MNNLLKICLIGIGLAAVAIFVFKLPVNSVLFFGFLLACPLLHVFMGHGQHGEDSKSDKDKAHSHH